MKNRKILKRIIIPILIIVFCINFASISQAALYAPANIKVGLFFDTTAKGSYVLSSPFKFSLFINTGLEEIEVANVGRPVRVEKDSSSNGYHIVANIGFLTYEEAFLYTEELLLNGISSFVVFKQQDWWQVWIGQYSSEESMTQAVAEVYAGYADIFTEIVKPSDSRIIIKERDSDKILFGTASKSGTITARTWEGNSPSQNYVYLENKAYRGNLNFKFIKSNELSAINELPLEEYVYGVVPLEIGVTVHDEALNAQAIVARTYALCQNKHADYGINVCNTTCCQVYGGYSAESRRTNEATDRTTGIVVTYKGVIVTPYYFSSSGGYTENSENVWVSSVPYLKAVVDDYDINRTWTYTYSLTEMTNHIRSLGHDIGEVKKVVVDSNSSTGRVLAMTISGTRGSVTFLKSNVREAFPNSLPSQLFILGNQTTVKVMDAFGNIVTQVLDRSSIRGLYATSKLTSSSVNIQKNGSVERITLISSGKANEIVVSGRGSGHGVGMAQWGAINMAEDGYTYDRIIKYFYTGVELETITLR